MNFYIARRSCIPLKPKRKREWWINEASFIQFIEILLDTHKRTTPPDDPTGWIRVREVREK